MTNANAHRQNHLRIDISHIEQHPYDPTSIPLAGKRIAAPLRAIRPILYSSAKQLKSSARNRATQNFVSSPLLLSDCGRQNLSTRDL
jgi:hypothetical protein